MGFTEAFAKELHSNKPINPLELGGKAAGKFLGNLYGATSALVDNGFEGLKNFYKDDKDNYNVSKMISTGLGAYAVPATVGRFASGGGLYHDSDGNFDIVGIPFI